MYEKSFIGYYLIFNTWLCANIVDCSQKNAVP
jgi:hypothetical protein